MNKSRAVLVMFVLLTIAGCTENGENQKNHGHQTGIIMHDQDDGGGYGPSVMRVRVSGKPVMVLYNNYTFSRLCRPSFKEGWEVKIMVTGTDNEERYRIPISCPTPLHSQ